MRADGTQDDPDGARDRRPWEHGDDPDDPGNRRGEAPRGGPTSGGARESPVRQRNPAASSSPARPIPFRCALGRLTVVRHGQSTANVLYARAEREDDPDLTVPEGLDRRVGLSPLGVRQAWATGRWLAGLDPADRPQIVVSSPYVRALRTWETMAEAAREAWGACPEPLVDERLRDRETGVIELMTPPAVRAHVPREAERRDLVGDWYYRPPGGESLADVALRVRDLLRELGEGASGRHVALIAHDAVVMAVDQVLAGVGAPPPDLVPVPNASVSRWDGDGTTMRLVGRADTRHLEGVD